VTQELTVLDLETALYTQGIAFVHFAPDERRVAASSKAFLDLVGWETRGRETAFTFLVPGRYGGICDQVPVIILEDPADMDPILLAEAEKVAFGPNAMIIRVGKL
jgi:hypothetical protein